VEALDAPYMDIGFLRMTQKRAGWLWALFLGELLTASAMEHFESELEKAVVLTLFIPLIDYGEHWVLVAFTVGAALVGIVALGSLAGSMLPFILKRIGFDPANASAPFVATLVDVTGLVIYFSIALVFLRGTLL
jgi:magnesium transporter